MAATTVREIQTHLSVKDEVSTKLRSLKKELRELSKISGSGRLVDTDSFKMLAKDAGRYSKELINSNKALENSSLKTKAAIVLQSDLKKLEVSRAKFNRGLAQSQFRISEQVISKQKKSESAWFKWRKNKFSNQADDLKQQHLEQGLGIKFHDKNLQKLAGTYKSYGENVVKSSAILDKQNRRYEDFNNAVSGISPGVNELSKSVAALADIEKKKGKGLTDWLVKKATIVGQLSLATVNAFKAIEQIQNSALSIDKVTQRARNFRLAFKQAREEGEGFRSAMVRGAVAMKDAGNRRFKTGLISAATFEKDRDKLTGTDSKYKKPGFLKKHATKFIVGPTYGKVINEVKRWRFEFDKANAVNEQRIELNEKLKRSESEMNRQAKVDAKARTDAEKKSITETKKAQADAGKVESELREVRVKDALDSYNKEYNYKKKGFQDAAKDASNNSKLIEANLERQTKAASVATKQIGIKANVARDAASKERESFIAAEDAIATAQLKGATIDQKIDADKLVRLHKESSETLKTAEHERAISEKVAAQKMAHLKKIKVSQVKSKLGQAQASLDLANNEVRHLDFITKKKNAAYHNNNNLYKNAIEKEKSLSRALSRDKGNILLQTQAKESRSVREMLGIKKNASKLDYDSAKRSLDSQEKLQRKYFTAVKNSQAGLAAAEKAHSDASKEARSVVVKSSKIANDAAKREINLSDRVASGTKAQTTTLRQYHREAARKIKTDLKSMGITNARRVVLRDIDNQYSKGMITQKAWINLRTRGLKAIFHEKGEINELARVKKLLMNSERRGRQGTKQDIDLAKKSISRYQSVLTVEQERFNLLGRTDKAHKQQIKNLVSTVKETADSTKKTSLYTRAKRRLAESMKGLDKKGMLWAVTLGLMGAGYQQATGDTQGFAGAMMVGLPVIRKTREALKGLKESTNKHSKAVSSEFC